MTVYLILGLSVVGVAVTLFFIARSMRSGKREVLPDYGHSVSRTTLRAVRERQRAGDQAGAADLLFRTGAYDVAADLYSKTALHHKAAEAYERAGKAAMAIQTYKRAGLREQAARLSVDNGMFLIAAKEFTELGQHAQAAECYLKAEEPRNAAEAYEAAGEFRRAGRLYARLGDQERAADMYVAHFDQELELAHGSLERIQEPRKLALRAAAYFRKAGRLEEAATIFRRAGQPEEAAQAYVQLGKLEQAAECFLQADRPEHAAAVFERLGDEHAAARARARAKLREGDAIGAARNLLQTGDFLPAARLFANAGERVTAAETYVRAGDLAAAAHLYLQDDQKVRAAELYGQSGDHEHSARIFDSIGHFEDAANQWLEAGNLFEAGSAMLKAGRREEALKLLARVAEFGATAPQARALEGRILFQLGQPELALQKFVKAIDGREPSHDTISLYYKAGRCAEAAGDGADAYSYYETVAQVDAGFRDVQKRLATTRQQAMKHQPASFQGLSRKWPTGPQRAVGVSSGEGGRDWPVMSRYELLDEIARGGMGVVYRARDRVLDRIVAFKVLSDNLKSNRTAVDYFLREARSVAAMSHPNIVTIYDAGEEAGEFYMAMEFVEGETLKTLIKRQGAFPEKLLRYITIHACRGMSYAHEKGLVHRDIKSGNLMLTRDKVLKIMDFGLAKFVEGAQGDHTKKIGTPYYMSPEQILGKELDCRSDIYSFGITLFECSTGKVPFAKGDLAYHHLHTQPQFPKDLNPDLSDRMNHLIARCIQKRPEDRFQNAEEILEAVK